MKRATTTEHADMIDDYESPGDSRAPDPLADDVDMRVSVEDWGALRSWAVGFVMSLLAGAFFGAISLTMYIVTGNGEDWWAMLVAPPVFYLACTAFIGGGLLLVSALEVAATSIVARVSKIIR